jgi:tRNA threonylcarbamoyladenosine biosynthesis protein TsaE
VAETQALGVALGQLLSDGDVIALHGPMGAGKTALAQGIGAGLEVEEPVSSPTFALVHHYAGRRPLWHVDAYRLEGPDEAVDLALAELLRGGGVLIVEWPERLAPALPACRLDIELVPEADDGRRLVFRPHGARAGELVEALRAGAGELRNWEIGVPD